MTEQIEYLQQTLQNEGVENLAVFALIVVDISQLLSSILQNTFNVILPDLESLQASLVQHIGGLAEKLKSRVIFSM